MLAFGPDDYLYIGTGDGGGGGDAPTTRRTRTGCSARSCASTSTAPSDRRQYKIPASNPFVGGPAATRSGRTACATRGASRSTATGDLWIGDVGQNRLRGDRPQADHLDGRRRRRGSNFGWRTLEGWHCFGPRAAATRAARWFRSSSTATPAACSVTGGYVYRGSSAPLVGKYIFADYCSGEIWSIPRGAKTPASKTLLRDTTQISSFGEDDEGELYVVSIAAARSTGSWPEAAPPARPEIRRPRPGSHSRCGSITRR